MVCCQYVVKWAIKKLRLIVYKDITDYYSTLGGNRTHTPERTGF
jgi:hypothetical protein